MPLSSTSSASGCVFFLIFYFIFFGLFWFFVYARAVAAPIPDTLSGYAAQECVLHVQSVFKAHVVARQLFFAGETQLLVMSHTPEI